MYCTNCKPPSLIKKGVPVLADMVEECNDQSEPSIFSVRIQHSVRGRWIEIPSHQHVSRTSLIEFGDGGLGLLREFPWDSVGTLGPGSEDEVQLLDLDNGRMVSSSCPESSTRKAKPTRPIRFTDPTGRKFEFPLEQCSTWQVSAAFSLK